jgi:hypothetical protein
MAQSSGVLKTALVLTVGGLWALPVEAYLDPATGSMILQGLLAGIAGAFVVLRLYWKRFKAFVRRLRGLAPVAEEEPVIVESKTTDEVR